MKNVRLIDFLDTESAKASAPRRNALKKIGMVGMGVALATLPFAGARRAFAQSAPDATDILNFALTVEYLEESYYLQGLDATLDDGSMLIPESNRDIFGKIGAHESAHVTLLADAVDSLGGTPVSFEDSDFDFTAGGAFDPFNNYDTYLLLSQAFEDTGVRAYKGQARFLQGSDLLTPALQIHSVEARHAAEVRRLRAERGASIKPWITLDDNTDGTPLEPVYDGEENLVQAGVDQTNLGDYSAESASEAYDEPLNMEEVNAIAAPFIA